MPQVEVDLRDAVQVNDDVLRAAVGPAALTETLALPLACAGLTAAGLRSCLGSLCTGYLTTLVLPRTYLCFSASVDSDGGGLWL